MAQYEEITIDQGADCAIEIHLVDKAGAKKSLTNHTVTAKMKRTYNADSADTVSFSTLVANPATDGIATLSLTNTQTDALKLVAIFMMLNFHFKTALTQLLLKESLKARSK